MDQLPARARVASGRDQAGHQAHSLASCFRPALAFRESVDAVVMGRKRWIQLRHRPPHVTRRVLHVIYDDPANPWVAGGGAVRLREIYRRLHRELDVTLVT